MTGARRWVAWSLAGLCLTLPVAALAEARVDSARAACSAPYRTQDGRYRSQVLHVAACRVVHDLHDVI